MVQRTESELKEKLDYALQLFYNDVLEKKDLRHFFFGMDIKRVIEDYHLYKHFVMPKPERYYKEMVMQTAPSEIQVKAPQFEEILISLQSNMRLAGFLKTEIPKLSVHVIEVIEESRAQKSDAEVKVFLTASGDERARRRQPDPWLRQSRRARGGAAAGDRLGQGRARLRRRGTRLYRGHRRHVVRLVRFQRGGDRGGRDRPGGACRVGSHPRTRPAVRRAAADLQPVAARCACAAEVRHRAPPFR